MIAIGAFLFDCAGNSYKKMSLRNPEKLLSVQDSLIKVRGDDESVLIALVAANITVAKKHMEKEEYNLAVNHYTKALILNEASMES